MKTIITLCLILTANFALGQEKINNDPSYSIHNYKHPGKAAYAKKHGLDKLAQLEIKIAPANFNYKQPYNSRAKAPAEGRPFVQDKKSKSYKHPMGL